MYAYTIHPGSSILFKISSEEFNVSHQLADHKAGLGEQKQTEKQETTEFV